MLKTLKFVLFTKRFMRIVFITDSYGGARIHKNEIGVSSSQTYPELLKQELVPMGHEVLIDFAAFRKLTDLPKLFLNYSEADVYVFQAGIVDCYPRVLSQELTISQNAFAKLIRKLIRINRSFFIRYIYNKPWSSEKEVLNAITAVCSSTTAKMIWLNVAPVNAFQERETPGANAAIVAFNTLLSSNLTKHKNAILLDIYTQLMKTETYEMYIHEHDSHLNIEGNKLYTKEVLNVLKKII